MDNLSAKNKLIFFRFLNDELAFSELQNFLFETKELEKELRKEIYTDFLLFQHNHKTTIDHLDHLLFQRDHKNAIEHLKEYVSKITPESEFETWKLTELLKKFINEPKKIKEYLDIFYDLYCGTFDEFRGGFSLGYIFLEHLGLNYFWWIDEHYLRYAYGWNWKSEYRKTLDNIEYYHQQLRPIAEKILKAIQLGDIKIISKGKYEITEELKRELESDKIFKLKHPE